jgi:hypothetical protein
LQQMEQADDAEQIQGLNGQEAQLDPDESVCPGSRRCHDGGDDANQRLDAIAARLDREGT